MEGFWEILELEPTRDISVIRQAYAQRTRNCHPEEDPEGFLELRKAYQAAVDYAEHGSESLTVLIREQDGSGERPDEKEIDKKEINEIEIGEKVLDGKAADEGEDDGWFIPDQLSEAGPNPFRDGAAIRQFMDIYTGKQRKDSKLWMDYFTSDIFLDTAWDSRFAALLLEKVTEVEEGFPLNREFMMWLYIAFHFILKEEPESNQKQLLTRNRERQPEWCQRADFEGAESIRRLAAKGPSPRRAGGDELAVLESFKDYWHLVRMAEGGSWNGQAMEEFKWIAGRYTSAYIKERCDPRAVPDYQRHPAGLRVFIHFFQRKDLPEELYRIVWQKYNLKSAAGGRMKIFYGALRELVTERIPGIEEEVPDNFLQLNRDRTACFARIQADPGQEERELAIFFAQENIQKALRSRRFVEEQLLSCSGWLNSLTPESFICRLREFYRENRDISGWERVVERAERELEYRLQEQKQKKEAEDAVPEELDLSLLLRMPERVCVQFLTGEECVFKPEKGLGRETGDESWEVLGDKECEDLEEAIGEALKDKGCGDLEEAIGEALKDKGCEDLEDAIWEALKDKEWEDQVGEEQENGKVKPLTEESLTMLFGRFAEGELTRLQLEFCQVTLVLVRDGDRYACFCFEADRDTWHSLLSQPEIYRIVDSKDVEYLPFGMGMLAVYSIHESPASILGRLNLVFMQIGREDIQVRMGDCWLWSSHTSQLNGQFKKQMAMQKLAKMPVGRDDEYILSKFVFSQYPDWVESVSLSGERALTRLRPGSYDLAAVALAQFFQKKLAKLRLSWEPKGQKDGAGRRHIILLQDGGQFMMAWLRDGNEQAGFYASDAPRVFLGRVYPACLVHRGLGRIRNCLDLIMDDMACAELVTGRPGEFVPADRPYDQVREELVDEIE